MASTVDIYGSKSALPSSATNGTIALVTGSDLTPGGSPSGRAAATYVFVTALSQWVMCSQPAAF